ncbi:MAG: hypothetical protein HWE25_15775 [Alphaproteobacteria bacterium]|nr:hypothetical protein [Alphaproteobacteria bacterium]
MKSTITLAATMLALLPTLATNAQDNAPPKTVCQTDPGFRQFDFWLGDWKVTDNATGKYVGNNKITAIEGECVVLEEWTGLEGSTGKSVNYYNPVNGKWRQLWLSAGAYAIDYEGGIKDGKMVLEGTIWYYAAKKEFPFRGTWTPNEDGSVRQYFEQFDPSDNSWKAWADGTYVKS